MIGQNAKSELSSKQFCAIFDRAGGKFQRFVSVK